MYRDDVKGNRFEKHVYRAQWETPTEEKFNGICASDYKHRIKKHAYAELIGSEHAFLMTRIMSLFPCEAPYHAEVAAKNYMSSTHSDNDVVPGRLLSLMAGKDPDFDKKTARGSLFVFPELHLAFDLPEGASLVFDTSRTHCLSEPWYLKVPTSA